MPDPRVTTVRRAFDAAFHRLVAANDPQIAQDELSNALHHLYRLGEVAERRLNLTRREFNEKVSTAAPGAVGALWIRAFDTHEVLETAAMGDLFSDYFTEMYEVLVWKPRSAMTFTKPDQAVRYEDYDAHLANRPALDSLRAAFDGLESVLGA